MILFAWFLVGFILGVFTFAWAIDWSTTEIEVCFYPNSEKQMVIAYSRAGKRAVNAGVSPIVEIPIGKRQSHYYSFAKDSYNETEAMAAYSKIEQLIEAGKKFRVAYKSEGSKSD